VAFVAQVADQHPLAVIVALFLVASAIASYWRTRLRGGRRSSQAAGAPLNRRSASRLALWLAVAVAAALAARNSIAETYVVASGSMMPTVMVGDRLLVDKRAYGVKVPFTNHRLGSRLPRRGDVVLVRPGAALAWEKLPTAALIKRVVGLPGDRISYDSDRLIVNGWKVPLCDAGPYAAAATGKQSLRGRLVVEFLDDRAYLNVRPVGGPHLATFTVPPGQVFLVGDNRGDSSDSRTWNGGQGAGVPVTTIEGRVTRILAGARRDDGSLDLTRLFLRLGPELRRPGLDLTTTNGWIGECLQKRPPLTTPPAAKS